MQDTREEAGRTARRQMRVHPTLTATRKPGRQPLTGAGSDENRRRREDAERKAIVSVHGEDLSSEDEIADAPEGKENAA
ncbi:MAG TPA: hypothetical protein VLA96_04685 [Terriglobales bacterium]|jgi:hypothetical protein|nr:hypothetical protein [Terriglobales bacterium]